LASEIVPEIWKDSYITSVQKIPQPESENDIRSTSLTTILAKILEDFFVCWMIEDISDDIDPRQFGSLRGSSTTYYLLDMIHNWLKNLDNPGSYLTACFLDFSKVFDRINHNIIIEKLISIMNINCTVH
jgi:retron-type reverse transcriptase